MPPQSIQEKRIAEQGLAASGRPRPSRPSVVGLPGLQAATAPSREPRTGGVLVIGREIEVKGEIRSCETLIVEGRLEAAVSVGSLQLAENGLFDGEAEVEAAEIAGRFEGDLTVRGELLLRPTARVQGRIRYGRIVIEGGGEISGDVAVLPDAQRSGEAAEA